MKGALRIATANGGTVNRSYYGAHGEYEAALARLTKLRAQWLATVFAGDNLEIVDERA